MKKLKFLLPIFVVILAFTACDDNDDGIVFETPSVTSLLGTDSNLSSLRSALERADLVATLSNLESFTVLAPTNDAFSTFLADNGFASLDDVPTDLLRQTLLNHVFAANILSRDLTTGFTTTSATSAATGTPMSIYINTSNGVRFNGISSVTAPDVQVQNGTIHVVDAVISLPTVVDLAIAAEETSSLVAAVSAAGLVDDLSAEGPFTVLAPTNNAFAQFLDDNGFAELGDVPTDVLTQTLLNHVIGSSLQSTDLSTGYTSTLATSAASGTNMSLYIDTTSGVRFNGISSVNAANINANNGVIHLVDAVIGLPSVVDFALADPNFSTLVAALTRDDLTTDFVSILSTPNGTAPAPFTVFAPINDAFADLLDELNLSALSDIDEPTLNATLTYHVVGEANVRSGVLTDNFIVPTLGGDITADVTGGPTLTDGNGRESAIIATDVQANNGVIHAINKVILPN
jgi:uncharacterized surface protein with fasciclin (FAS1) repeats